MIFARSAEKLKENMSKSPHVIAKISTTTHITTVSSEAQPLGKGGSNLLKKAFTNIENILHIFMNMKKNTLIAIVIFVVVLFLSILLERVTDNDIQPLPEDPNPNYENIYSSGVTLDEAYQRQEQVNVIISLVDNEQSAATNKDMESRKLAIKEIQEQVLATLTPEEFVLSTQYTLINAIAGSLSRTGYEKLLKNPQVSFIEKNDISYAF